MHLRFALVNTASWSCANIIAKRMSIKRPNMPSFVVLDGLTCVWRCARLPPILQQPRYSALLKIYRVWLRRWPGKWKQKYFGCKQNKKKRNSTKTYSFIIVTTTSFTDALGWALVSISASLFFKATVFFLFFFFFKKHQQTCCWCPTNNSNSSIVDI